MLDQGIDILRPNSQGITITQYPFSSHELDQVLNPIEDLQIEDLDEEEPDEQEWIDQFVDLTKRAQESIKRNGERRTFQLRYVEEQLRKETQSKTRLQKEYSKMTSMKEELESKMRQLEDEMREMQQIFEKARDAWEIERNGLLGDKVDHLAR
eukprot:TRINITY_DN7171_c0_g1_i4.p1 TRINITY_DN7171_c0_g1~~TRINITY_DN7171_c0_g1_i4.p1  ORF type:complete len:153 (+),score=34.24 TRINITY_DN7171_c0_g1_i4:240-698(+)